MNPSADTAADPAVHAANRAQEPLVGRWLDSPLGRLRLIARGDVLVAVLWPDDRPGRVPLAKVGVAMADRPVLDAAARQLDAYFAGRRQAFDLPMAFSGTPFQCAVWRALGRIPFGQTSSYRALAQAIGRDSAVRAVGAANGRNPLSIVVPCHRVIGTSGGLTGFAGGLAAKEWLLRHERAAGQEPARREQGIALGAEGGAGEALLVPRSLL